MSDFGDTIRSLGLNNPTSGLGTETYWDAANSIGVFRAFDRNSGLLLKVRLQGKSVTLLQNDGTAQVLVDENGDIYLTTINQKIHSQGLHRFHDIANNNRRLDVWVNGGVVRLNSLDDGTAARLPVNLDTGDVTFLHGAVVVSEGPLATNGDANILGSINETVSVKCVVYATVAQSIPNATNTALTFSTLRGADPVGMWNAGSPKKLTIQRNGTYLVGASVRYNFNATGFRHIGVYKNGAAPYSDVTKAVVVNRVQAPATAPAIINCMWPIECVTGDYIEAVTVHDSGAALSTDPVAPYAVQLSATRMP